MIVACEGLARGSYSTWLVRLVAYLGCRCHLAWVSGLVKAAAMWADTQIVSSHSCFISTFDSITHLHPGGNMRDSSVGLFCLGLFMPSRTPGSPAEDVCDDG